VSKLPQYYELDPNKVLDTTRLLSKRIDDRFPDSGLSGVCRALTVICKNARERSEWIAKPNWPLRILTYGIILLVIVALAVTIIAVKPTADQTFGIKDFVELLEAGINDIILIGAAVFFLVTLEGRYKRRRALEALHEIRSIAHVIDMHQLTKDPERLLSGRNDTEHSPKQSLTAFELRRYLDYCAEMLSLCGKIASLYVNNFEDPAAVATVNEIEDLTTGLSRKIWQKIMISQSLNP
jgi:hypothetical protein